ncbi:DUF6285 domain-containing protein [Pseudomonas alkylphenolica]|uniref:DUF6285 domain-containing protein n=1 Tax=Pseudomonas alkylphenolica TaxID=237609 RepID=UPI0018D8E5C1|nr:DUF6285 domain-containing protein [Pseudomonas alkylphenolica]MBH3429970.1 hypothetical protein [Pseudomonas alkylphenolica]
MSQHIVSDLLACARELLLSQLLPALPPPLHYEARMIANALAIAGRELDQSPACHDAEWQALNAVSALLGQPPLPLEQAKAVLSEHIRLGAFDADGDARRCLLDALRRSNREQLNINNPKVLADE